MALPSRLLALALPALAALGCASAAPSAPRAAAPAPASPDAVLRWVLGATQRVPAPPTADRMLLALPANKPLESGTRVTPTCLDATSFLPAPQGDPRIFFLVRGQVYARQTPGEDPAPLAGNDPALGVTRLLALENATAPLRILVTARPRGVTSDEIWSLTVDAQGIQAATPVRGYRSLADQASFFAKYNVPRCLPGGRNCLVVSTDAEGSYLDVEPTRGQPPEPFEKLEKAKVLDAAWASADGQSLYLMLPCP